FDALDAPHLTAGWFHDNPACGRVLEKLGCQPDGEEERTCLSRGTNVFCHKVVLRRADYELRKATPCSSSTRPTASATTTRRTSPSPCMTGTVCWRAPTSRGAARWEPATLRRRRAPTACSTPGTFTPTTGRSSSTTSSSTT